MGYRIPVNAGGILPGLNLESRQNHGGALQNGSDLARPEFGIKAKQHADQGGADGVLPGLNLESRQSSGIGDTVAHGILPGLNLESRQSPGRKSACS